MQNAKRKMQNAEFMMAIFQSLAPNLLSPIAPCLSARYGNCTGLLVVIHSL